MRYFTLITLFTLFLSVYAIKDACFGIGFICYLTESGAVRCSGDNTNGQLGRASVVVFPPPDTLTSVTQITCGAMHVCAINTLNEVYCWGDNQYGQIGDGSGVKQTSPVKINLGVSIQLIKSGFYHSCALLSNNNIKCWGLGAFGQLGTQSTSNSVTPTNTFTDASISFMSVGAFTTCAQYSDNTIKCFGRNSAGQLSLGNIVSPADNIGDNVGEVAASPNLVSSTVKKVVGGSKYHCWLFYDNNWSCSGDNTYGTLAYGDINTRGSIATNTPSPIHTSTIIDIEAYTDYVCTLSNAGSMACYGLNSNGQLGINSTTNYGGNTGENIPKLLVVPPNLSNIKLVNSPGGSSRNCILAADNNYSDSIKRLYCWGSNTFLERDSSGSQTLVIPNTPVQTNCGNGIVESTDGEECDSTANCNNLCKLLITTSATTSPLGTSVSTTSASTPTTSVTPTSSPASTSTSTVTPSTTSTNILTSTSTSSPTIIVTPVPCIVPSNVDGNCIDGELIINTDLNITTETTLQVRTTIVGNLTISNNTILILDINGSITVQGCAVLGGSLQLDNLTDTRTVLTAACIEGQFTSIETNNPCIIGEASIITDSATLKKGNDRLSLIVNPKNACANRKAAKNIRYIAIGLSGVCLVTIVAIGLIYYYWLRPKGLCTACYHQAERHDLEKSSSSIVRLY